jgi:5-(carboxyamino)imidazole ribonucleotide mutase
MSVGSLGARNAALFAAQILGLKHDDIREAFENYRNELQGS